MRLRSACLLVVFGLEVTLAGAANGAVIYNNLTPNNLMGLASRPDIGATEIEAADDFVLGARTLVNGASFVGLLVPGTGLTPSISDVVAEMYRVFPADSNTTRTPNVPTRFNSPSDVALDSRDSASGGLTFTMSVLNPSFTVLNSVQPGGIHLAPPAGDGPLTGQEVQVNVTFTTPFDLSADHYFFVPQVALSGGAQFYWLSASRPISGPGTTPVAPDLQSWTRDAALDPDWLRVGTDIVGGAPAPTFNAAFSLEGNIVPEPATFTFLLGGLVAVTLRRFSVRGKRG
ncbi:MAG: PEP-CTERM sorting domain-containing protein [Acidobacteriia bacterium]|nr:PEP-CTERM sorting domain-containing protein [Terriglobia bacterium]